MSDRARRAARTTALVVAVVAYLLPLAALPLRAIADRWHAPSLLPQELGWRGIEVAASQGSSVPTSLVNSLVVAIAATLVAGVLAWPAARTLATRRRTAVVVFAVLVLPLLVPELAVGMGLATWLLQIGAADSLMGIGLAHLVYVLPYVTLLLAPGFTHEVRELEDTARVHGANPAQRMRLVTVPAVLPSLATALLMGFVVSWSQYGTSLAVGGGTPMLPLRLVPFVHSDPQVASVLALVFLAPVFVVLVLAVRLGRFR